MSEETFLDTIDAQLDPLADLRNQHLADEAGVGDDLPPPEEKSEGEGETPSEEKGEGEGETPPEKEGEGEGEPAEGEGESNELDGQLDLDNLEDDWTPKAAHAFKTLKAENAALKKQASEADALKQRIQELEAAQGSEDVETLRSRVGELEAKTALVDLQSTTAYQEQVAKPINELVEEADSLAKALTERAGVRDAGFADRLLDALSLADPGESEKALGEVLESVEPTDREKYRLFQLNEKIVPLLRKRQEMHRDAKTALAEAKELEERTQKEELARRAEQRKSAAKAVVERVREKAAFLEGVDGIDFDAALQTAQETDPSSLDAVTGAYQTLTRSLFPGLAKAYLGLRRENEKLVERLAEFDKADPGNTGRTPAPNSASNDDEPKSFLDAIDAAIGG